MSRRSERVASKLGYPVAFVGGDSGKRIVESIARRESLEKRYKKGLRRLSPRSSEEVLQEATPTEIPNFTVGPNGALHISEDQ